MLSRVAISARLAFIVARQLGRPRVNVSYRRRQLRIKSWRRRIGRLKTIAAPDTRA
jgi:uncharacterized membrane protein YdjX (TVP38/TMEM64 family)